MSNNSNKISTLVRTLNVMGNLLFQDIPKDCDVMYRLNSHFEGAFEAIKGEVSDDLMGVVDFMDEQRKAIIAYNKDYDVRFD